MIVGKIGARLTSLHDIGPFPVPHRKPPRTSGTRRAGTGCRSKTSWMNETLTSKSYVMRNPHENRDGTLNATNSRQINAPDSTAHDGARFVRHAERIRADGLRVRVEFTSTAR